MRSKLAYLRLSRSCATAAALTMFAAVALESGAISAMQTLTPAAQVAAGSNIYKKQCASCHGANLEGGTASALRYAKPSKALPSAKADAADLAKYIRLYMPVADPGSLSVAQSYSVTAFILAQNGRTMPGAPLSAANAASLLLRKGTRR